MFLTFFHISTKYFSQIPSLNNVPLDEIRTGTLVKYRCMVQDVFDPQFCLGAYNVVNAKTRETKVECGAFRDFPALQVSRHFILFDDIAYFEPYNFK